VDLSSLEHPSSLRIVQKYIDDLDNPKLLIDYIASIEDLYSSFVHYIISTTRSLNILSLAEGQTKNIKQTWSLHLTTPSEGNVRSILFRQLRGINRVKPYRASGSVRSGVNIRVQDTPEVLSVEGFV
jgi:hypothetical protein